MQGRRSSPILSRCAFTAPIGSNASVSTALSTFSLAAKITIRRRAYRSIACGGDPTNSTSTPPRELKPNPRVLLDIINSVGARKERCVYVGDSLFKAVAGQEGCMTRATVSSDDRTITVHVPWKWPSSVEMARALARAFRWRKLLEAGVYGSAAELAVAGKIDRSCLARFLRGRAWRS